MQKKLIALAIAGLASSAAFAQSNVQIYGVMDMGMIHAESGVKGAADKEFNGIATGNASGSRLGFKATEDLGGGMSAGALWEFGTMQPDGGGASTAASANNIGSTRQSYLFLSGKTWGTVQMGRIYTAGTNYVAAFDTEGASFFGPVTRLQNGVAATMDAGSDRSRLNNSVAWLSPDWNGFTGQVQYSFGESGRATVGSTDDSSYWGGGVKYANGPLALAAAYNDFSKYGGQIAGTKSKSLNEWILAGSYNFGMLSLFGTYQDFDADNMSTISNTVAGVNGNSFKGDIWHLGVRVPFGKAGEVRLSYADLNSTSKSAGGLTKTNVDADGWGVSYWYTMSKRTTFYVGYVEISNDKGSAISVGSIVGAPSAGQDSSGYGLGMRHTF